ncbi:MAG: YceI family protein [Rhodanobacteraceae bacterium]
MRNLIVSSGMAAAILLSAGQTASASPVTYTLDPNHTDIVATWDHFGFSRPSAMFDHVTGTLTYDPDKPGASSVEVSIPVSSVHTSSDKLDEHLQSSDFFDVAKWPNIHFKSTHVEAGAAPGALKVTGDLTVHGVTRPITLDVHVNKVGVQPMAKARAAAFNATAHLNRSDFGVKMYVPMVSDRIDLSMTTEAVESSSD